MAGRRKLALLGAVIIAGAAGQAVQSTHGEKLRAAASLSAARPAPVRLASIGAGAARVPTARLGTGIRVPVEPALETPALVARSAALAQRVAGLEERDLPPVLSDETKLSGFGLPCTITATATPADAASVRLKLEAPCRPYARVTIAHAGMAITGKTSYIGEMTLTLPVLMQHARVTFSFSDGASVTAKAEVPAVNRYQRVAVAWRNGQEVQIHAREFGANDAAAGNGHGLGRLVRIGDATVSDPRQAEIYSFPLAKAHPAGLVRLDLQAPVTSASCGRETDAVTLRAIPGQPLDMKALTFTVPACGADDEYLLMRNLLPAMRIPAMRIAQN